MKVFTIFTRVISTLHDIILLRITRAKLLNTKTDNKLMIHIRFDAMIVTFWLTMVI